MTIRIPSKDFVLNAELDRLEIDEQIKINHTNCTAGMDTRQRLYVKKIGANAYVAHCFNCGGSGYEFGQGLSRMSDRVGIRATHTAPKGFITNEDYLTASEKLPLHVLAYLKQYDISEDEARDVLFYRYSAKYDMLFMPFSQYGKPGFHNPQPFQGRNMRSYARPRYITFVPEEHETYVGSAFVGTSILNIVLVEDQISAYRVWRAADRQLTTIALLGTNLLPAVKNYLVDSRTKRKIFIWLDKDTAGYKATMEIVKELRPMIFSDSTIIPMCADQPKDLSDEQIVEELKKAGWTT